MATNPVPDLAAKARKVIATSSKTPVPTRTVVPPKGKPKPVPALTPSQVASKQVAQLLAPQYDAQQQAATAQNAAVTNFTKMLVQQLQGVAPQVGRSYDQAIGQQTNLSNAAADSLRAANPNTQDQALLSAINAPGAQHDAVGGQNNAAFNGAAAVGQYVGGVLPLGALQAQKQAAVTEAMLQPGFEGLRGQQALAGALYQQNQDRAKIGAQGPQLTQQVLADQATADARKQQLALEYQTYVQKGSKQTFDQWYKTQVLGQNAAKIKTSAAVSIAKYNASVSAKASKIDVAVSKASGAGIALNSNGQPVKRNGKTIPFNANGTVGGSAKPPTAAQVSKLIGGWKTGKVVSVHQEQFDSKGKPITDSNGAPVYKSVSAQSGQLKFGQAYRRLRAMGLTDVKARQYLDTAYARGEQGRAWVTNEEQAVLKRAKLPSKARVVSGHGVLTVAQAHALQKAGKLPPGQQTSDGFYVIAKNF